MYKTIFWDNDWVLVDTEPLFFKATKSILNKVDIDLSSDFYRNEQLKKNISHLY